MLNQILSLKFATLNDWFRAANKRAQIHRNEILQTKFKNTYFWFDLC